MTAAVAGALAPPHGHCPPHTPGRTRGPFYQNLIAWGQKKKKKTKARGKVREPLAAEVSSSGQCLADLINTGTAAERRPGPPPGPPPTGVLSACVI